MAEQEPLDEGSMSLIEHLTELRNRIGFVMLGFVVVFLACFIRPFGSDTPNIAEIVYLFLPLLDIGYHFLSQRFLVY